MSGQRLMPTFSKLKNRVTKEDQNKVGFFRCYHMNNINQDTWRVPTSAKQFLPPILWLTHIGSRNTRLHDIVGCFADKVEQSHGYGGIRGHWTSKDLTVFYNCYMAHFLQRFSSKLQTRNLIFILYSHNFWHFALDPFDLFSKCNNVFGSSRKPVNT